MNSNLIDNNHRNDQLLRQIPVGVYVWRFNADGTMGFEYVNSRFCEILGLSPDAVLKDNSLAFSAAHPDDADRLIRDNEQARIMLTPFRWEGRFVIHNEIRWVLISSEPTSLPDGSSEWHGVVSDFTRHKEAEIESQLSEKKWRDLFNNMTTGFALHDVICDKQGKPIDYRFLEINPAFEELTGLKASDMVGHTVLEMLPGTEPYWIEIFGRVALSGEPTSFENYSKELGRWYQVRTFCPKIGQFAVIISNITDRKEAEEDIRKSEERFRIITSATALVVWATNAQGEVTGDIPAWRAFTGQSVEELKGWRWTNAVHPEDVERVSAVWSKALETRSIYEVEYRLRRHDGVYRLFEVRGVPVLEKDESVREWVGVCNDVTERKQAEHELSVTNKQLLQAQRAAGAGVWDWDLVTGSISWSEEMFHIFGLNPLTDKASFDAWRTRLHPEDIQNAEETIAAAIRDHIPLFNEFRMIYSNGDIHWVETIGDAEYDESGNPKRMIGLCMDVTEKKISQQLIWQQANFDSLTELPNRRMFYESLAQEIMQSDRSNLPLAMLLIDLDEFKQVNDTLGHDKGDILLKEAAHRIADCIRVGDTLARLGGDEFIVVLSQLGDTHHAEDIAQKILNRLAEPFQLVNEVAYLSASIGITLYPGDATEIKSLMKNADQAMYLSKFRGRNRFSHFTPELQEIAQARLRLTNDLRGALAANQFQVYYQPIVELATGITHKAEALIRWHHPENGIVSPAEFIPLAETTGLIVDIGFWVFKQAARQVKLWQQQFNPSFEISVNRSPVEFHNFYVNQHLPCEQYLAELELSGQSIVYEITEGVLLDNDSRVIDTFKHFNNAGIRVALDDFGTGYSSLSYIRKFKIDYLKIDKSFVENITTDTGNLALCEAIIVMAHKLGLKVIAEGVETGEQRRILADAGCDFAQGYLFSKPVAPEEFEKLLRA